MNTQSHVILNLLILRKVFGTGAERIKNFNFLVFFGALLPDLPMFVFFLFYTILGTSQELIWRELYFSTDWQIFFNLFNSIPIFLLILGGAYFYKNKGVFVLALSGLLHFVGDFFVHQEDGHAHFFPLTDWKFMSEVSYWDPSSYGQIFGVFETLLVLVASVFIWKYLKTKWGKILLVLANLLGIFNYLIWQFVFRVG